MFTFIFNLYLIYIYLHWNFDLAPLVHFGTTLDGTFGSILEPNGPIGTNFKWDTNLKVIFFQPKGTNWFIFGTKSYMEPIGSKIGTNF